MVNGNKFRIYPTDTQRQILLQWIGCQRFIYNSKVGEDRYFRRFARKALSLCGTDVPLDQKYSQFITPETSFLREVPSQVLRNGAYRWRAAYQRFITGAAKGRPTIKRKNGRQSVFLTKELFVFEIVGKRVKLSLGTKKFPVGKLAVNDHNEVSECPASLSISVDAGRWFVSFSTDDGIPEPSEWEIAEQLKGLAPGALRKETVGIDRGVKIPIAVSDGTQFDFSEIQKKKMKRAERYKKRWQRIAAKRQKGSNRKSKALQKAAHYQQYCANVRHDFAHKTSRTLADLPNVSLFVFEDLKVQNMTRSAKGSIEQPGSKVKQKSGLNRSILGSAWGKIKVFTQYKSQRIGKLAIAVSPHRSSQECRLCGFTHPENRVNQALFVCQSCDHTENADFNAAGTIKNRGVSALLAGEIKFKKPRHCGIRKLGVEQPEVKPVGEDVSRCRLKPSMQTLLNREETPTTTCLV